MITITCILYYRLPLTDIGTLRIRGSYVFGGVYRLYDDTADKYNTYFILPQFSPGSPNDAVFRFLVQTWFRYLIGIAGSREPVLMTTYLFFLSARRQKPVLALNACLGPEIFQIQITFFILRTNIIVDACKSINTTPPLSPTATSHYHYRPYRGV